MKIKRQARSILIIAISLLTVMCLMIGCFKPSDSESLSTSGSKDAGSTATTSATSASKNTASETGNPMTSGSTSSSDTAAVSETTVPLPVIDYRPLPANQVAKIDLNQDGIQEAISYRCVDDYSFNLVLNQQTIRREGEMFLPDWFFLIDLDGSDDYLDVAVQELGPSDDYQVSFFYFNGSRLVLRGVLPGMICDVASETIGKDPFGKGTIKPDGAGSLTARARGAVLHTWFFDEPWILGSDGLLKKIHQDYYPLQSNDPDTGEVLPETAVRLLMDLPLVQSPGSSQAIEPVRSGQTVSLTQTDNQSWVQLRKSNGELGWFLLVDGFQVVIGGSSYFSGNVFEGLSFAD